jgi:cephalosporin-C deacetylase-like acetyl esterase
MDKLVYESEPGILVPSLLFIPQPSGERRPAILYAHGRGKSVDARPGGEIEELVRKGFIVFAVDYRGIGETSATDTRGGSDFPRYFGDYGNTMTALLTGKTLVGMRAQDLYRALDVLATRQEVDAARITAIAKETATVPMLHLAALDGRINRLALEAGLVSYESVVLSNIHMNVFENVVPKALKTYDLPDLIAAVAPRPVWLIDPVSPMGRQLALTEVRVPHAQNLRRPPDSGTAVYAEFLKQ